MCCHAFFYTYFCTLFFTAVTLYKYRTLLQYYSVMFVYFLLFGFEVFSIIMFIVGLCVFPKMFTFVIVFIYIYIYKMHSNE